jgi:hypothetical protein
MNKQSAVGTGFIFSNTIANASANSFGVAKTGTAISSLYGAAHTNATAAWIGFGSMKMGMLMMGCFPILGAAMLLDSICGQEHGSPIIDWYEEAWKTYECQCELEEMKKDIKIDRDHQLRPTNVASSLTQLDNQFRALEVENELYQMKKQLHGEKLPKPKKNQVINKENSEKFSFDNPQQELKFVQNILQKARSVNEITNVFVNWKGEKRVALTSGIVIQEKGSNIYFFGSQLTKMLILSDNSVAIIKEELNQI